MKNYLNIDISIIQQPQQKSRTRFWKRMTTGISGSGFWKLMSVCCLWLSIIMRERQLFWHETVILLLKGFIASNWQSGLKFWPWHSPVIFFFFFPFLQLLDFRQVLARLLGLDINTLSVPDYEIISRLERLVQAHHAHSITTHSLEASLQDMENGFRAGYDDAVAILRTPSPVKVSWHRCWPEG